MFIEDTLYILGYYLISRSSRFFLKNLIIFFY